METFKRFRWKPFRKKKAKVNKVRFNPVTTIYTLPSLSEEEKAVESEKRWQTMLECLKLQQDKHYKQDCKGDNYNHDIVATDNVCTGYVYDGHMASI